MQSYVHLCSLPLTCITLRLAYCALAGSGPERSQGCSYLWGFAFAPSSAWNTLPLDICVSDSFCSWIKSLFLKDASGHHPVSSCPQSTPSVSVTSLFVLFIALVTNSNDGVCFLSFFSRVSTVWSQGPCWSYSLFLLQDLRQSLISKEELRR